MKYKSKVTEARRRASLTLQKTRSIHDSNNIRASLTLQETRSIHDSMNIPKLNLLLIFAFSYKCLKYKKNIFNFGIKTVL